MTIQLKSFKVSDSEAAVLRRMTGKNDPSAAALQVVSRAIKRERSLAHWEPPTALARMIKKEADRIDRLDTLNERVNGRAKSAAVKRRRA